MAFFAPFPVGVDLTPPHGRAGGQASFAIKKMVMRPVVPEI
jgi:hypothetical protein